MTDAESGIEVEGVGPSLAVPPLYLLRVACRCPECGTGNFVHTLGCAAFRDAEEEGVTKGFHFLHHIRRLPDELAELLRVRCPDYFLDEANRSEPPYLLNHCQCDAILGDDFLHGDVGAPFWPETPNGFGHIKVFRLPIGEPTQIACSYTVGGGEYLNLAQARWW